MTKVFCPADTSILCDLPTAWKFFSEPHFPSFAPAIFLKLQQGFVLLIENISFEVLFDRTGAQVHLCYPLLAFFLS